MEDVAVADPPQAVASSMAVTSSTGRRANQRLGTAFCGTLASYPEPDGSVLKVRYVSVAASRSEYTPL